MKFEGKRELLRWRVDTTPLCCHVPSHSYIVTIVIVSEHSYLYNCYGFLQLRQSYDSEWIMHVRVCINQQVVVLILTNNTALQHEPFKNNIRKLFNVLKNIRHLLF